MSAKSRNIGAVCERAVVHAAAEHGLDATRVIRTATSRDPDPGDVHIGPMVCQVKGGKAAKDASEALLGIWWAETCQQADRVQEAAGLQKVPVLAVQRRGTPQTRAHDWTALVWLHDLAWLHDPGADVLALPDVVVRLPLGSLLAQVTT